MKGTVLYFNTLVLLISFLKPIQSNAQNEIKFGTQVWMSQNLNVDTFRNGDKIPEAKSMQEWDNYYKLKQPAYCFYEFDKDNETKYGRLYNWYALNDQRNLSPIGWRIPNSKDWHQLIDFVATSTEVPKIRYKYWHWKVDSTDVRKGKLKKKWEWELDKSSAKNKFWFSQLGGDENLGEFSPKDIEAMWWSKDGKVVDISTNKRFWYFPSLLPLHEDENDFSGGFSIRCIKN